MWRRFVAQLRARRASKAAIALITPLVERSRGRLNGIAESTWSEPYVIGFVTMMITIIAKLESPAVEGSLLCDVQADAWAGITGTRANVIGEDLLLLSAARHPGFELGCRHALEVHLEFCRSIGGPVDRRRIVDGLAALHESDWSRSMKVSVADETVCLDTLDLLWAARFDTFCRESSHCSGAPQHQALA